MHGGVCGGQFRLKIAGSLIKISMARDDHRRRFCAHSLLYWFCVLIFTKFATPSLPIVCQELIPRILAVRLSLPITLMGYILPTWHLLLGGLSERIQGSSSCDPSCLRCVSRGNLLRPHRCSQDTSGSSSHLPPPSSHSPPLIPDALSSCGQGETCLHNLRCANEGKGTRVCMLRVLMLCLSTGGGGGQGRGKPRGT